MLNMSLCFLLISFIFDRTGLYVNENGIVSLPLGLHCLKSNNLSRLGLRGIDKGSVNVDNYVDVVASIHPANITLTY